MHSSRAALSAATRFKPRVYRVEIAVDPLALVREAEGSVRSRREVDGVLPGRAVTEGVFGVICRGGNLGANRTKALTIW